MVCKTAFRQLEAVFYVKIFSLVISRFYRARVCKFSPIDAYGLRLAAFLQGFWRFSS